MFWGKLKEVLALCNVRINFSGCHTLTCDTLNSTQTISIVILTDCTLLIMFGYHHLEFQFNFRFKINGLKSLGKLTSVSQCQCVTFCYFPLFCEGNVKIFGYKVFKVSVTYICLIVCQKIERKANTVATMANFMKIVSV